MSNEKAQYRFELITLVEIAKQPRFPGSEHADKEVSQHKDWAKLIAASGIIAISAQPVDAPL